eukprot:m.378656 g.378656  ORF g.378656 m.378656 type:complete len:745 (+) comp20027_c1_seq2:564-2798(+)
MASPVDTSAPDLMRRHTTTATSSEKLRKSRPVSELVGFLCPLCPGFVKLDSQELLAQHWEALHKEDVQPREAIADDLVERAKAQGKLRDHDFEEQTWAKPKSCQVCGGLAWRSGLACTVCKMTCHKKCVGKIGEETPELMCVGTERYKQKTSALVKTIRKAVTGRKARFVTDFVDLDLTYITPNIIAMSFPATGLETTYRNDVRDVAAFLQTRHKDHYMVYNVSEKNYDASKFNNQVLDFGWPDHLAPTLERLCSVCKSVDGWLKADSRNVAVVHCKGGKGRTGVVIAAYMTYVRLFTNPDDAMQQFAIKRFTENDIPGDETGITQPSQRRYVRYFSQVLAGDLRLGNRPLSMQHIVISGGTPAYGSNGGVRIFVRVYLNLTEEIYCSEPIVYPNPSVAEDDNLIIPLGTSSGLCVTADVLVRCYHKTSSGRDIPIFRAQFHTSAVRGYTLTLLKHELDDAHRDKRFPASAKTSFVFRELSQVSSPDGLAIREGHSNSATQSVLAGFESTNPFAADAASDVGAAGASSMEPTPPESPLVDALNHPSNPFSPLYVPPASSVAAEPATIPVDCEYESWFFGTMPEAAARRLLMEKSDAGAYLVRTGQPSGEVVDLYVDVNCGDEVQSFRIDWDHRTGYGIEQSARCQSIARLLKSFRTRPLCVLKHGVALHLTKGFGMKHAALGRSTTGMRRVPSLKPIARTDSEDVRMARSLSTSSADAACAPLSPRRRADRRLSFVGSHSSTDT